MAFQDILEGIYNEVIQIENTGKVADYIPELAKVDANNMELHWLTNIKTCLQKEILWRNFLFKVFQK